MADSGYFASLQQNEQEQQPPVALENNDVNAPDNLGNTALHRSVSAGDLEDVNRLLTQQGIDINAKNFLNETPLILAARRPLARKVPVIMTTLLAEPGIKVNQQDNDHNTALMHAVKNDEKPLMKALLNHHDTDTSLKNKDGATAFTSFVYEAPSESKVEVLGWFLAHRGHNVNHQDSHGRTALMIAVRSSMRDVVKRLLEHQDTDVNAQDNTGSTALMYLVAKQEPNQDILDLLLERQDLDVNVKDAEESFALLQCCHTDSLRKLLQHHNLALHQLMGGNKSKFRVLFLSGKPDCAILDIISEHPQFDINDIRGDGHTDLTWAAAKSCAHLVRYLLKHPEIQVSQCDKNGCSPLMYLAQTFNTELMKELTAHPTFDTADYQKKDKDSQTFLHHLFMTTTEKNLSGDTDFIVSLIKEQEVDPGCQDTKGYTALMCSIEFARKNRMPGLADIIQILLEKCTAPTPAKRNKYNHTVLDLVREYSHDLEAPIKGVFRQYMEEETVQQCHSNLSVAKQLEFLRKSIHSLKLTEERTNHLIYQVDQLESDVSVFTDGHYGNELGMLKLHRDKLIGRHVFLLENLQPNDVLPYLKQDRVLTDDQIEEIRAQELRPRVVTKLLSILPTRGPEAYQHFINALNNSRQKYIATELEKFDPDKKKSSGALVSRNYGAGPVSMVTTATEERVALSVRPGRQMSLTFVVRAEEEDSVEMATAAASIPQ